MNKKTFMLNIVLVIIAVVILTVIAIIAIKPGI